MPSSLILKGMPKSNRKEIDKLAVEGKKAGMTYGQFVAQEYAKQVKIVRRPLSLKEE